MSVVSTAEVPVFPTFQGFRRAVVSEVDASAGEGSRSFASRFGDGIVGAAKGVGVAVGATIAAGAGIAAASVGAIFAKGLDRALNIQDAQAQLKGLGHSADEVTAIMTNALASVKGTAFGLDDAAKVAASAVAAGVKPGQDLERTLKLTADAATIAKVPLGEMGQIFGKVASSGKLNTEVLNQFSERGVPLLQFVAKQYGVTAEAAADMVSHGEVDFANFQAALEAGVGGAALASGDTARGAFANIGAAFSRMGQLFAQPAVDGAPSLFQSIAGAVDRATAVLVPYAAQFSAVLTPAIAAAAAWIDKIDFNVVAAKVAAALAFIRDSVSNVIGFFQGGGFDGAGTAFDSIGTSLVTLQPAFSAFLAQLPKIGEATATLAGAGLTVLTQVLSFLADHVGTILQFMPAIVAAFVAWRVASAAVEFSSRTLLAAQLAALPVTTANTFARLAAARAELQVAAAQGVSTGATNVGILARLRGTASAVASVAGLVALKVAQVAGAVASGVATAAQWAFNAALTANPIGIIIALIVALVAGLVFFFTQTKLGQEIWANFTRFLGEAWANIVNVATTVFTALGDFFSTLWNSIVLTVTTYINIVSTVITTVVTVISTAWNLGWAAIGSFFETIWNAIVAFVTAYINTVMTVISTVVNAISIGWSTGWAAIGGFFQSVWNAISSFIGGVVNGIASAIVGFVSGVQSNVQNVLGFIQGIPGQVLGFLGNIGNLLVNSGRDLIQGFIDGIKGMIGKVGDAVGGVMDFVGGFFPHSPAKRGQFSGSGWQAVRDAGLAIGDQLSGGLDAATPGLNLKLASLTSLASSSTSFGSGGGSTVDSRSYPLSVQVVPQQGRSMLEQVLEVQRTIGGKRGRS